MSLNLVRNPDKTASWILTTDKDMCSKCKKKLNMSNRIYYCKSTGELYCFNCSLGVDHSNYVDRKTMDAHIHYKVSLRRKTLNEK